MSILDRFRKNNGNPVVQSNPESVEDASRNDANVSAESVNDASRNEDLPSTYEEYLKKLEAESPNRLNYSVRCITVTSNTTQYFEGHSYSLNNLLKAYKIHDLKEHRIQWYQDGKVAKEPFVIFHYINEPKVIAVREDEFLGKTLENAVCFPEEYLLQYKKFIAKAIDHQSDRMSKSLNLYTAEEKIQRARNLDIIRQKIEHAMGVENDREAFDCEFQRFIRSTEPAEPAEPAESDK